MAELVISQDEEFGIQKEIDEGALDLLFKAVQEDIYSFPIPSFIRETISNCLDSIIERQNYAQILSGVPIDKFYLNRPNDNKLLKDSYFDESYYNIDYLSSDSLVHVTYTESDDSRDSISIKDYGVGLGGHRLKGFFKIGYSTKRNMKSVMGKFGSGSKSALATGVDYFTLITTYNGYKTTFMIYKNDYEPITPEHPNGKKEEWEVTTRNGTKKVMNIYWEPTTEYNGVEVLLDVKKHNKTAFIKAIDQFQYFRNKIHLCVKNSTNILEDKILNSEPYYESDALIIPKVSTLAVPHILVDGISYGAVSWQELELDNRIGRIGIKVSASEVDITQSRESLKWTEKTKSTILEKIEIVNNEASSYVAEKTAVTNSENFFEFAAKSALMYKSSADEVSSVFSKFLDINRIVPKFKLDVESKYGLTYSGIVPFSYDLFEEIFYKFNVKIIQLEHNKDSVKIKSTVPTNWIDIAGLPVVYAVGSTLSASKAQYLLNHEFDQTDKFLYIRPSDNPNKTRENVRIMSANKGEDPFFISTKDLANHTEKIINIYCNIHLHNYDFPINLSKEEDEKELTDENYIKADVISAAKYRALNQQVFYRTVNCISTGWDRAIQNSGLKFVFEKNTSSIASLIDDFEGKTLIICPASYKELGHILEVVINEFKLTKFKIVYVAQDVIHLFLPYGTLITDYYRMFNPKTKELMIGELIYQLNTLKEYKKLHKENSCFLSNLSFRKYLLEVDEDKISKYSNLNYPQLNFQDHLTKGYGISVDVAKEIAKYLDNVTKFQKILSTGNEEEILKASKECFGVENVYTLDGYDEEFISSLEKELNRVKVVKPIAEDLYNPSSETIGLLKELINFKTTDNVNI